MCKLITDWFILIRLIIFPVKASAALLILRSNGTCTTDQDWPRAHSGTDPSLWATLERELHLINTGFSTLLSSSLMSSPLGINHFVRNMCVLLAGNHIVPVGGKCRRSVVTMWQLRLFFFQIFIVWKTAPGPAFTVRTINIIYKILLIISGTWCNWTSLTLMSIRSVLFWRKKSTRCSWVLVVTELVVSETLSGPV